MDHGTNCPSPQEEAAAEIAVGDMGALGTEKPEDVAAADSSKVKTCVYALCWSAELFCLWCLADWVSVEQAAWGSIARQHANTGQVLTKRVGQNI